VDAVHRIAGPVLADAHDHRGRLKRALPREHASLKDGAGKLPVRKRHHTRVHQEERFGCDALFLGKQTERIAAAQDDRAELVTPAADRLREDLPFARLALTTDREDTTGQRLGPVGLLGDLEPQLAERAVVAEL